MRYKNLLKVIFFSLLMNDYCAYACEQQDGTIVGPIYLIEYDKQEGKFCPLLDRMIHYQCNRTGEVEVPLVQKVKMSSDTSARLINLCKCLPVQKIIAETEDKNLSVHSFIMLQKENDGNHESHRAIYRTEKIISEDLNVFLDYINADFYILELKFQPYTNKWARNFDRMPSEKRSLITLSIVGIVIALICYCRR